MMKFPRSTASIAEVEEFIKSMGFAEVSKKMSQDEIDGDALYLLGVADLQGYGMKKGPALKLHRSLQESKPPEPSRAAVAESHSFASPVKSPQEALGSVSRRLPQECIGRVPEERQGVKTVWRSGPAEVVDEAESTESGEDLGITVPEFEAILAAFGFDYNDGFAHTQLQDSVVRDLAWCQFKDPCNGYSLSSGIKMFMSQDLIFKVSFHLSESSHVTLTSGAHGHQNLLQASGITGKAEVFLCHWQGEAVIDTLGSAKDFVQRHGSASTRFWLDFVNLNHNKAQCFSHPDRIKATIVRPGTLAVSMNPWHGGQTLTRMWCCLEIGLHVNAGQDVVVVMVESEKQQFLDVLQQDYSGIRKQICQVDVSKAEASRAADRDWVLQELRGEGGSYQEANQQIASAAFSAFVAYAKQAVKDLKGKSMAKTASQCNNLGLLLHDAGDLAGAEPLYRRALSIAKDTLGMGHPEVAAFCNNLGMLLEDGGDLSGAELRYRQALAISEKALGLDHPTVAIRCSNLGVLLGLRGDFDGAEPLCRRALDIDAKMLGMEHPDVAIRCSNLGLLLQARGDLVEAEPFLCRALDISEMAFGLEHPDVATDCNNLAILLQELGNLEGAESLYRTVLEIDQTVLGMDHLQVAIDLNNLASLLQGQVDIAVVEPLLRRALAIDEKALGMDHPDVATDYNNLGSLLEDHGDLQGAEDFYRRALEVGERAYGTEHPNIAMYCNNLGMLLMARCDFAGAESLCRRALAIDEKLLGAEHEAVAMRCANLGRVLQSRGDLMGAEPLLRRALDISEKALGAEHPNVALRCIGLAMLLQAQGNLAGAETLFCWALAINGKAFSVEHPNIATGCNNLGRTLTHVPEIIEGQQVNTSLGSAWQAVPRSARGLRSPLGVQRQSSLGVERSSSLGSSGVDRQVSLRVERRPSREIVRELSGTAPSSASAPVSLRVEKQSSREIVQNLSGTASSSASGDASVDCQVSLGNACKLQSSQEFCESVSFQESAMGSSVPGEVSEGESLVWAAKILQRPAPKIVEREPILHQGLNLSEVSTFSVGSTSAFSSEPAEGEMLVHRASTLNEKLALCRENLKVLLEAEELRRQGNPWTSHGS